MNKSTLHLLWMLGIGLSGNVFATSSPRIYSAEIGSYYQIFYSGSIDERKNAADALVNCKARGGHLVTITSKAENSFLNSQFYQYSYYFLMGASDAIVESQWKWTTGEPWNYTAWAAGQPSSSTDSDYVYYNTTSTVDGGRWNSTYPSDIEPYVCEWESSYVVTSAAISDLTGDKVAESAVYKYVKGVRTVNIINPVTGASVSKLTFGPVKSLENSFIAPVSDMNGNKKPEIAVMYKKSESVNVVVIKDPSNNAITLKTFNVGGAGVDVLSMISVPDLNRNGVSELQFLTRSASTGVAQLLIFDSETAAKIKTLTP